MRWTPESAAPAAAAAEAGGFALPAPPLWTALGRGLRNRCPFCGEGKVFAGYLTVVPACSNCRAPLGLLRADDAPPYFVIFLVGHLLVPPVFWVEKAYAPPMWLHMVVWLPLFAIACTLLLRPIKGAVVGWMSTLGFVAAAQDEARGEARVAAAGPDAVAGRPHA
ncbi:DUF983 domain-containing protein [Paracraurococcus ruber]|uniref:DUF983 domain-containing protein n=1 Tax=Paracraurococcus ruber TaxID=77675 RepID=A0ABS1D6J8_9PROT|nr:DUF983 domain-containing protein [Paracraurococcus ruber]MBK1662520.1 hypothetical protein [Paracraurococcus ruber]TDG21647.1 DUF983 domain-containing protein [Paracraurococcus ruber]